MKKIILTGLFFICFAGILHAETGKDVRELFDAIKSYKNDTVESLLKKGVSPDSRNSEGVPALVYSAREYNTWSKAVFLLVKYKAGINIADKDGTTPLMAAAYARAYPAMRFLIKNGADINARDNQGDNALMCVLKDKYWHDHMKGISILLENGADVNLRNKAGLTPLLKLVYPNTYKYDKDKIAGILLKNGANPNDRNNDGNSVIMLAAAIGKAQSMEECFNLLWDQKPDLSFRNKDGYSALEHAVLGGNRNIIRACVKAGMEINVKSKNGKNLLLHLAALTGDIDTAEKALGYGADINYKTGIMKETALIIAAGEGHLDMVKYLVSGKAWIKTGDSNGETALMHAAANNHPDIMEYLLKKKARIDYVSGSSGDSPLMLAAGNGHLESVKLLISMGAQIDLANKNGYTALMGASDHEVVEYLIKKGADIRKKTKHGDVAAQMVVSSREKTEELKVLIRHGAKLDYKDEYDNNLLMKACEFGKNKTAEFLIGQGIGINNKNRLNYTALDKALDSVYCKNGCINPTVFMLLEKGATGGKISPIHAAAAKNNLELMHYLLDKGSDINRHDNYNSTPLITAIEADNTEMAEYLISRGVDVNIKSRFNKTSMELAEDFCNYRIIKLLKDSGYDPNIEKPKIVNTKTAGKERKTVDFPINDIVTFYDAVQKGDISVVRKYVEKGMKLNISYSGIKNIKPGFSPLMTAAEYGQTEVVKYLLSVPDIIVDQTNPNDNNKKAIDYARRKNYKKIVELLENHR